MVGEDGRGRWPGEDGRGRWPGEDGRGKMVGEDGRVYSRGVGEGGAGGAVAPPPTFESWGAQPLQFFASLCAPFLTRPPSSQLAPTPLYSSVSMKWLVQQSLPLCIVVYPWIFGDGLFDPAICDGRGRW